jgi:uncharacterized protein YbaR (Trm112 family)
MHLKRALNFPASGLCLEIGGGSDPHPRSDVLVDRYLDDEGFAQRGRAPLVVGDRALICADGAHMPFRKQQFDYVMLSHVIEHVSPESIKQFVAELQRVGRAGYIEAPSILYEAIRDIPEHVWYVVCRPGVVHLCRKTSASRWRPFLDPLFLDANFCAVMEEHAELFFTGIEWDSTGFRLEIHENLHELLSLYPDGWAQEVIEANLAASRGSKRGGRSHRLLRWLPRQARQLVGVSYHRLRTLLASSQTQSARRTRRDWRELVVCPACYGDLAIDLQAHQMNCTGCHRSYLIREDGIPSFVDANPELA